MNAVPLLIVLAAGQCFGGVCARPNPFVPAAVPLVLAPVGYNWKPSRDGSYWILWRGSLVAGGYNPAADTYRPWDGQHYGDVATPPVPVPDAVKAPKVATPAPVSPATPVPAAAGGQLPPDGVIVSQMSPRDRHVLTGREVDRTQLVEALGTAGVAGVPDDSQQPRLSVLGGTAAERQRILTDLASAPELAPFQGHVVTKAYPADHWVVKDNGFLANPQTVTLYAQQPNGRVLWRADGYPGIGTLAEGLRRVRPDYDPAKDPKIAPETVPGLSDTALLWLAAVAVAAAAFYAHSRRGNPP